MTAVAIEVLQFVKLAVGYTLAQLARMVTNSSARHRHSATMDRNTIEQYTKYKFYCYATQIFAVSKFFPFFLFFLKILQENFL